MSAGASTNVGILHETPYTDVMGGTASHLLDHNDDDDIKEVDMSENEPVEIIDIDADNVTDGQQEYPTDENLSDNPSKNQYGVSNTVGDTAATSTKDTTKD